MAALKRRLFDTSCQTAYASGRPFVRFRLACDFLHIYALSSNQFKIINQLQINPRSSINFKSIQDHQSTSNQSKSLSSIKKSKQQCPIAKTVGPCVQIVQHVTGQAIIL